MTSYVQASWKIAFRMLCIDGIDPKINNAGVYTVSDISPPACYNTPWLSCTWRTCTPERDWNTICSYYRFNSSKTISMETVEDASNIDPTQLSQPCQVPMYTPGQVKRLWSGA